MRYATLPKPEVQRCIITARDAAHWKESGGIAKGPISRYAMSNHRVQPMTDSQPAESFWVWEMPNETVQAMNAKGDKMTWRKLNGVILMPLVWDCVLL